VKVTIQVQERAKPLAKGHGPTPGCNDSKLPSPSPLPGEYFFEGSGENLALQVVMFGQKKANSPGKAQNPLPIRHVRQYVIDEMCGGVGHAPSGAGRAETAALAREGHEPFPGAFRAGHADEAAPQEATVEKTLKFADHEIRVAVPVFAALARDPKKLR
jgi:hypothetical protein